jgi:hypothetical protein
MIQKILITALVAYLFYGIYAVIQAEQETDKLQYGCGQLTKE